MKNEKTIEVAWADCDPNGHVRHSKYYEYGAHSRISLFNTWGFSVKKMSELGIGPVLFKEECSFIKELGANDTIRINMLKGEVSEDGSRWILHHELFNSKHEKSAHITIKGGWIDLNKRKLTVPPKEMSTALHALAQGQDYVYKKA